MANTGPPIIGNLLPAKKLNAAINVQTIMPGINFFVFVIIVFIKNIIYQIKV